MNLPRPFGPYTLLSRLAVGGMAEIYVAKTRGLGGFEKLVAIKLVHPHLAADAHFVRMLVDEAKILVLLTHANVAQVFDLGCIDDTYYIAMEYVEGMDVHRLQQAASRAGELLPIAVSCFITAEVLNGLDYAHRRRDGAGKPLNLVHRDVSPQNVLISHAGEVKLVDFGIAKTNLRGEGTEVGIIKGKYYYMSPEQAWADPMDRRSDIFSTGIVLYEMLTGRMLYSAQSIPELITKVREAEIRPPELLRPEVPAHLSQIVMKALEREPDARYQSAVDMGEALRDFLYAYAPQFNSTRLSQYLSDLVEAEARAEREKSKADTTGGLSVLTRAEFVRNENSVIFSLPDAAAPATRNEVLPAKLRRPPASTAPTPARGIKPPAWVGPPASPYDSGRESAPPTEIMERPVELQRISAWPHHDPAQGDPTLDEPTKFWSATSFDDAMNGDETLIDERHPLLHGLHGRGREAFDAPIAGLPGDTDPTGRHAPSDARGLAQKLPPPSNWPEPDPLTPLGRGVSGQRSAPFLPGPTPALVPPPGEIGPIESIPPTPPLPDFSPRPQLFRNRHASSPWLQLGIGMVFALLGILAYQWSRSREPEPMLEILSVPVGAEVSVDGTRQQGVTPLTLTRLVPQRRYELEVALEGYIPWRATYTATPGAVQHIAVLKPITAVLQVTSVPSGAQVWLDGVAIGRTPLTISSLTVGRKVRLRAAHPDYGELRRELMVRSDDLAPELKFTFGELK
jgi:serine/threonine-protein kinase